MTDTILSMRDITKEFPGVRALSDVNFDVRRGEIHSICGENGAGKSTLMKVLSGVHPHGTYSGQIFFDGEDVEFRTIRDSERAGIVIIHQELALIPLLSITENLFLGNEDARRGVIDWLDARQRAVELLARVGLDEDPDTIVRDIGIGKQQLVEIAKALAKDVKLLILDEPTAALNEGDSQNLLSLLGGLRDRGITSIMISHKLNEIEQISDAITIIRDGRTIETLQISDGGVDEDRIIRGMVGRDLDHRYPPHESHPGEVLLEIRDWTVAHPADPNRIVVDRANLTVRRGEVVGLAGLMGAGRTELARSVFGQSWGTKRSGTLLKDGKEIHARSVGQAIDAGLAYVTEDRKALGLNLLDSIKVSITSAGLKKIRKGMAVDDNKEVLGRRAVPHLAQHQDPRCRGGRLAPLRRQPAEGRPGEVDVHRARRPHPRRAHPRHRRRGQVRDLRDHQPAGRLRPRGARDLLRAARAARHLRPHLHPERRRHHRRRAP